MIVVVGRTAFAETMVDIFGKMYPDLADGLCYANSLDEAYGIINRLWACA